MSVHSSDIRIEQRPTDALIPFANNARTHSAEQVMQIAASIVEFGFTNAVLIDDDGRIIAGHGRVLAARQLSMDWVPCIVLRGLSEAQQRAYVIADNKLALNAGWDMSILRMELSELQCLGVDLSLLGFAEAELNSILEPYDKQGRAEDDAAPLLPEAPVSVRGDLWTLGDHRVLCGDSTSAGDMTLLMEGDTSALLLTDPPYGMAYGGGRATGSTPKGSRVKAHGMILNDELVGDRLISLVQSALFNALTHTAPDAGAYICGTWRTYTEFVAAMAGAGLEMKAVIVWDKKSIGLGNAHYRPQHEFIFYRPGSWHGDKAQSDVWSLARDATVDYAHPTQKPVELIVRALRNSSRPGDVVLDLFGGSGSVLIGCEKTSRSARLMELDPKYVDVIVKRWQDWTGREAVLEGTSNSFLQVLTERLGTQPS